MIDKLRLRFDMPTQSCVLKDAHQMAVVLIGERPGLTSPDSLGIYITLHPKAGSVDSERNCISNVRPEGLPYSVAAKKLLFLMREARRLGITGIGLKEDADGGALEGADSSVLSTKGNLY